MGSRSAHLHTPRSDQHARQALQSQEFIIHEVGAYHTGTFMLTVVQPFSRATLNSASSPNSAARRPRRLSSPWPLGAESRVNPAPVSATPIRKRPLVRSARI